MHLSLSRLNRIGKKKDSMPIHSDTKLKFMFRGLFDSQTHFGYHLVGNLNGFASAQQSIITFVKVDMHHSLTHRHFHCTISLPLKHISFLLLAFSIDTIQRVSVVGRFCSIDLASTINDFDLEVKHTNIWALVTHNDFLIFQIINYCSWDN